MEQLLQAYRNSIEHIITRLARFHIEFEGIHPFIDGNGRTGRLLVNLEKLFAGYVNARLDSYLMLLEIL